MDSNTPETQPIATKEAAAKAPKVNASLAPKKPNPSPKNRAAARPRLNKGSISDEVVIKFNHVTKVYHLYKTDRARVMGEVFGIHKGKNYLGVKRANDDLSFEIKKGEAVAFIGHNGAGKSTALKMITGVLYPTKGSIEINGHVTALLELSAGFNPNFNAYENIELRGQILGFSKEELERLAPEIIDFADLGVYAYQPLSTYSSGMRARLGFGFAVTTNPDILIVDEALSVGDKTFKKKCIERIREIMSREAVTVLFVTHSSAMAKEFCSRGIVLANGKLVYDGPIDDAIEFYDKNY